MPIWRTGLLTLLLAVGGYAQAWWNGPPMQSYAQPYNYGWPNAWPGYGTGIGQGV